MLLYSKYCQIVHHIILFGCYSVNISYFNFLPYKNLRIVPSFLYSAISPVYKALDYKMKSPAPGYPASTWPLIVDKAQTYGNKYSIVL